MKRTEPFIGILLLIIAVGFNLWLFRAEPTALIDPNDNTFQFALVDRTNQILTFAQQKCSGISAPFCTSNLLIDHWVPNWAEGYNLPHYYSHVPQILIVISYRLFTVFLPHLSLFAYYHWIIYLLLCIFPVTVFISLRVIRLPWLVAGAGALIATHLSTDGLYGLDPASFLWRGYGLSSQLFAMIWLPPALAFAYRYFTNNSGDGNVKLSVRELLVPALFLATVTSGHLGLGIIAFMSIAVLVFGPFIQSMLELVWERKTTQHLLHVALRLSILFGIVGLLLGYWIFPILKDSNYHNISVWDGIWKFDSFGFREVLKNLFNGDLFDFGRLPILTTLLGIGFFTALQANIFGNSQIVDRKNASSPHIPHTVSYFPFSLLFLFWLLMYFGRTTWGGLFSLIPGMSEYHLSRFIVGVHIAGIFLIPIGIDWLMKQTGIGISYIVYRNTSASPHIPYTNPYLRFFVVFVTVVVLVVLVYPQTIRYAAHNDFLITRANTAVNAKNADITRLMSTINVQLAANPGRVFAGRGGSWGKTFRMAETPMYMHLSTYGIPVILWLPETWSPSSDTEQYFSENNPDHYTLYNVRLVATPIDLPEEQIQPFWRLVETGETWKLYSVVTANEKGYITTGVRPAVVSTDKQDYRSVVRLWMHSAFPSQGLYPELTFDKKYPKSTGLPNFRMLDEATYKVPDGSLHNLFTEVPSYVNPPGELHNPGDLMKITSQSSESDMIFKAAVEIKKDCNECLVVLRQTFHPSWQVTVNGRNTQTFTVFPFFTAVSLETPGTHEIIFSYRPSATKQTLITIGLITLGTLLVIAAKKRNNG